MKVVESETGSSRKLLSGGLAALALAAVLMIWNAVSKPDAEASGTPATGASGGKVTTGTTSNGTTSNATAGHETSASGKGSSGTTAGKDPVKPTPGETAKAGAGEAPPSKEKLAALMNVAGKAQPPADLPPIEELLSKMPDGSPVKPIEIPDMTPVIRTESDKVLADVESRAEANPEAAASFVESMPHGDLREEAVAFVVEQWSKKDPAKASAWQQRMEAEAREN